MQTLAKKPEWLNKKISLNSCQKMKAMLNGMSLHTVCEEASCPNISECFLKGTATFMILGNICTRNCQFCGVENGIPKGIDTKEPKRVAEAVERLKLKHAVITSVTRDDLKDGGAGIFAETISAIRSRMEGITIEVLIPDLKGNKDSLKKIAEARPDIINHNTETVPRLYPQIRPEADYGRSLELLKSAKGLSNKGVYTKSGFMVGLGEKKEEVLNLLYDLREAGCDFLSIGQYLSPSFKHYPVKEYIAPEIFDYYKKEALHMGFASVASAPYVRSGAAHEKRPI